jgi:hypothetical protein
VRKVGERGTVGKQSNKVGERGTVAKHSNKVGERGTVGKQSNKVGSDLTSNLPSVGWKGHAVAQWLTPYVTEREVAGSSPDELTIFISLPNPSSSSIMVLEFPWPLTWRHKS